MPGDVGRDKRNDSGQLSGSVILNQQTKSHHKTKTYFNKFKEHYTLSTIFILKIILIKAKNFLQQNVPFI